MKKIKSLVFCILTFFIIATPLCAAEWGHFNYIDTTANYEEYRLLLKKIMRGESISYCLDGNTISFGFENLDNMVNNFEGKGNIYDFWLSNTWAQIEKAGRQEEFANLKNILTTPVIMRRQQCSIALNGARFAKLFARTSGFSGYKYDKNIEDIRFIFSNGTEAYKRPRGWDWVRGVYYSGSNEIPSFIVLFSKTYSIDKRFYETLLHETGHSLGMADQDGIQKNSSRIFKTKIVTDSIMSSSAADFSCDDADGLINLIDRLNNYRRGGDKGWRSLCPHYNRVYVDSKPVIDQFEPAVDFKKLQEEALEKFKAFSF
jgi:hypothetical protein